MDYILWFKEISKKDIPLCGGKGANLGELTKLKKINVPYGFCVTSNAYFDFIKKEGILEQIKKLTKGLKGSDIKAINLASEKIKKAILEAEIPKEIKEEIKKAYLKLGRQRSVAVRSSATAEDLPTASFAGQQATFLNVKGVKNVIQAVKKCWASLFEPRAIFYRIEKGFSHEKVKIAVPIHLMVLAEKSGVMFTIDPVTNDRNKISIEAGYGLGEAVVSGAIIPDRYLVDKRTLKILKKDISKQSWLIDLKGAHKKVPKPLQEKQKLTDKEILKLAKIGKLIEAHYKFPQDIEWVIGTLGGKRKKIFIVQTRPVTTLELKQRKKKLRRKEKVLLKGIPASLGVASGKVRILHSPSEIFKLKKGEVLVTEMTNPQFVPAMKKAAAIITDSGGRTSHAAIVSRELGIPCVVGTGKATQILKNGQEVTVDGTNGKVFEGKIKKVEVEFEKKYPSKTIEKPPLIGTKLYVNLSDPDLAEKISKEPVDGVGLLRAEFMILRFGIHPRLFIKERKQKEFIGLLQTGIEKIAKQFYPRPVIYRALDFKTSEYRDLKGGEEFEPIEPNPMIGYRGCFRYIKEPELFSLELKAIKEVRKKFKNLWLMIPFVRTLEEFKSILNLIEKQGLKRSSDFKLWLMVEVPSVVILIDKFLELVDGISIGSNDLTQLILAVDRDNEKVAEIFDERNEAVRWAIQRVINAAKEKGVSSSICGEAPSVFPEIVEFLIKAGITSISVEPDAIFSVRSLIASVERKISLEKSF